MKGKLFSAVMVVIVLVLVLAMPASAGKPTPPPPGTITVTVGTWSYKQICPKGSPCSTASNVTARNIAWSNASAANYLVFADYYCTAGTAPGATLDTGCVNWTEKGRQSIAAKGTVSSKTFEVDWYECMDYYPAVLLVHTETPGVDQVMARALGTKIAGVCY